MLEIFKILLKKKKTLQINVVMNMISMNHVKNFSITSFFLS